MRKCTCEPAQHIKVRRKWWEKLLGIKAIYQCVTCGVKHKLK